MECLKIVKIPKRLIINVAEEGIVASQAVLREGGLTRRQCDGGVESDKREVR